MLHEYALFSDKSKRNRKRYVVREGKGEVKRHRKTMVNVDSLKK